MNENKKIAFNSIIIFVRLCVVTVISLISSRIVLQALGASDFGLYNVVGGIVLLLNVINTAMVSTTYRYIAFELGKGEKGNTNKVFNASFAIHASFSIIILILGLTAGLFYVNNYLNVEADKLSDARFVLILSIVTTMISTFFIPYSGLLVAYERFHVPAIIDVISNLLKLCFLFSLLYYDGSRLRLYSLIMLGFSVIKCTLVYFYSRKYFYTVIRLNIPHDMKLYREIISFSGWILFGTCSSVGKTQGSAMIINYFFGTVVNAAFAIANQIDHFVQLFARSLNNAAIPQITKSFSGGNKQRSVKLASYISKYTFILMSIVSIPIMIDIDYILSIWLKDVPEGSSLFCQLMILGALIGSTGEGVPALIHASGKIKYFQLTLPVISLMGLPLSVVLYIFGSSPEMILIVYCFISFVTAIVRLFLLKYILKIDVKYFVKTSYLKIVLMAIPMIGLYYLFVPAGNNFISHILGYVFIEVFLVMDFLLLGTDKNERSILFSVYKKWKS